LFNVFKPLLFKVVRPAIQKVLEKQIKDSVHQLDGLAYEIHQEAQRAAEAVKNDPENAPNIYSRYAQAAQQKIMQGKQKSEAVSQDKKVNVAVTQHDSIFKDIKLPGGISTKATEYKELAAKGDKWESPVFGIGSARESTNIGKVAPISRKPHGASSGSGSNGYSNGQTSAPGYGQSSGEYGQTNGSAGFSNQVNEAFGGSGGQDYSLKNNTGTTGGTTSDLNGVPTGQSSGNTLLGKNNPVLSGSA